MAEDFSDQFSDGGFVKICGECEKEQRIDQKPLTENGWTLSHSVCARHAARVLKSAGVPDERIKQKVSVITTRDLSDEKNKPLVEWLKNPPVNYEKHQQNNPHLEE